MNKYAPNDPFYNRLRVEAQTLVGAQSPSSADGGRKKPAVSLPPARGITQDGNLLSKALFP
jgi:hypothetical protein